MSKLHNRVLLPNGQFASFPEKKLDDEVKYEQIKEEKAAQIKEALQETQEKSLPTPNATALKKTHNAKAKKENVKKKEKQDEFEAKI